MALASGDRLGAYEIVAVLGAGGMGEVYRARDTALDRDVALKILPESVSADPDRLMRFEREAKTLASLNHPNIAQVYGFEHAGDVRAIAMELVEGRDLSEVVAGAQRLPLEDALPIARQIAEALEAAHDAGIIHRDLKPANIKVRTDGTVKVLDFGLAKAMERDSGPGGQGLSSSPTMTSPAMTEMGMILGTAAYMAPEQAKGKPIDKRADIWAFGAVLYEMLTGTRAFAGSEVTEVLASVLAREPDWTRLPAGLSPVLGTCIRRCLQKDPKQRIHDIADMRLALDGAFETTATEVAAAVVAQSVWRRPVPLAIAASVATALIAFVAWSVWPPSQVGAGAEVTRLGLDLPPGQHLSGGIRLEEAGFGRQRPSRPSFALSPDGRHLVYAASDGSTTRLYRRPMNQDQATPIPGTDGGSRPFFSPTGDSVGFVADGELKRVPIDDGAVRTIGPVGPGASTGIAFSWTEDDRILGGGSNGIYALPATGGRPVLLTEVDQASEGRHLYPQLLPGGRALLFNAGRLEDVPSERQIVVQSLPGGTRQTVGEGGSHPRYLRSGHIVFARDGNLMAVPFDVDRLQVTGDEATVLEDVMQGEGGPTTVLNQGAAQFDVSATGDLAYVPGGIYPIWAASLVLVDQRGMPEPLPLPQARYLNPRFSPDGKRLSYTVGSVGDFELSVLDLETRLPQVIIKAGNPNAPSGPVWSPGGTRLVVRQTGADEGLFTIAADRSGAKERVGEHIKGWPSAWSKDDVLALVAGGGVSTLRMDGQSQPEPFVITSSSHPDFSPDGHWIAYVERGAVYVRPFPAGAPQRVSPDGSQPVWSHDGNHLFYTRRNPDTPDLQVMVVDVVTEPAFRRSEPRMLFEGPYGASTPIRSFDVSPNGDRFVMLQPHPEEPEPVTNIRVVLNWFEELKRLAPVR